MTLLLFCFLTSTLNRKVGEEEGKLQKIEYLKDKKNFLGEIKSVFQNFLVPQWDRISLSESGGCWFESY